MVWDRQDRQAGRKTENIDRKAGSQTDRSGAGDRQVMQTGRKTEKGQIDRHVDILTGKQTGRKAGLGTGREIRLKGRQKTDRQAGGQEVRRTKKHDWGQAG